MQFEKVETAGPATPAACARCQRPLDEYFALANHMLCRSCADAFSGRGGAPFWRGLLFGLGAAIVGALVWYGVSRASGGSSFGLIGIVVGLFVGFAVRKGSRGRGGWRYQALAMVLTYLAITTSYVPEIIEAARNVKVDTLDLDEAAAGREAVAPPPVDAPAAAPGAKPVASLGGFFIVFAFVLAAALPFMGGVGFMGWIIIGIALYEAWKINRRLPITGPFRLGGPLSVPAPAPVAPAMPPPAAGT